MVAETLTGLRAKKKVMPFGHGYGGALYVCHGGYAIGANVEDGDIFELMWTPANFLCLGGWISGGDLDTHGTETLDMDLGWAANGGGSETMTDATDGKVYTNAAATASASGLVNAGVLVGDASVHVPVAGIHIILNLATPLLFTRPTLIQLEANAAAATGGTGTINAVLMGRIL